MLRSDNGKIKLISREFIVNTTCVQYLIKIYKELNIIGHFKVLAKFFGIVGF